MPHPKVDACAAPCLPPSKAAARARRSHCLPPRLMDATACLLRCPHLHASWEDALRQPKHDSMTAQLPEQELHPGVVPVLLGGLVVHVHRHAGRLGLLHQLRAEYGQGSIAPGRRVGGMWGGGHACCWHRPTCCY